MTVTAYGALHAVGVAAGVAIVFACAERRGLAAGRVAALTVVSFAAAAASAWLAGALLRATGDDEAGAWSGLGFPVCLAAGWLLARLRRMPPAFVDACAVALPLALAIGRVGCFTAGCCGAGVPVEGASYWKACPAPAPRTQLWDAAALAGAAALVVVAWRRGRPGGATAAFLLAFGVARFVASLWRPDLHRAVWALNADQLAAALSLLLGAAIGAVSRPSSVTASGTSSP